MPSEIFARERCPDHKHTTLVFAGEILQEHTAVGQCQFLSNDPNSCRLPSTSRKGGFERAFES